MAICNCHFVKQDEMWKPGGRKPWMLDAGWVTEGKKGEQKLLPFLTIQGGDSPANAELQRLVKCLWYWYATWKHISYFTGTLSWDRLGLKKFNHYKNHKRLMNILDRVVFLCWFGLVFWCEVLVLCFLGLIGFLFVCFSDGIYLLMSLVSVISEKQ